MLIPSSETRHLYAMNGLPAPDVASDLASYGTFKMGFGPSVAEYAQRLSESVKSWLACTPVGTSPRFIASPPRAALPAAANLLADSLGRFLNVEAMTDVRILALRKTRMSHPLREHYAWLRPDARLEFQRSQSPSWVPHPQLQGATVLFINDVYVTGAQQREMQCFFDRLGVRQVTWQYLFRVIATELEEAAAMESRLNAIGLETDEKFLEIISRPEVVPTTRLVYRLLELDQDVFERAVDQLPPGRSQEIVRLVELECSPDAALRSRLDALRLEGIRPMRIPK